MKTEDAGFTMMEVLVTVAVVLLLGSLLVTASKTAMQGSLLSNRTVRTAETIKRIDRFIRESASEIHIPYWENPAPIIDSFISGVYRAPLGSYFKTVRVITDKNNIPSGIEAVYAVNKVEMKTIASFSSAVIMENIQ